MSVITDCIPPIVIRPSSSTTPFKMSSKTCSGLDTVRTKSSHKSPRTCPGALSISSMVPRIVGEEGKPGITPGKNTVQSPAFIRSSMSTITPALPGGGVIGVVGVTAVVPVPTEGAPGTANSVLTKSE